MLNDLRSEVQELKDVVGNEKKGVNPQDVLNDEEAEPLVDPQIQYDRDLDDLEPTEPQAEIANTQKDEKDIDFSSKFC